jgi:hypothetical protein
MNNAKLERKLSKTWKQLLKANVQHDEHHAAELFREMIALEIEQKKRKH